MIPARRVVSSRDNPGFRRLLDLAQSAKARRRGGQTVLEGIHLCVAWTQRHPPPAQVFVTDAGLGHDEIRAWLGHHRIEATVLTDPLFAEVSSLQREVGLVAIIDVPVLPLPTVWPGDAVYLDRIQDPGNLGTLLRTCAAAGIPTVLTAPRSVAAWAPKVMRAGMGAHVQLAIHEAVPWSWVRSHGSLRVLGTRAHAATPVFAADLRPPRLWLFGNEGEGLSEELAADVQEWVGIPQAAGVESLNVAAAAAVCLFEQRRQRTV